MTLRAYAKINLGLHVVGKRPDGYHDIETVFHQIDLFDEIEIVQSDEGPQFVSDVPGLASDSSNLCIRAMNVLRDLTGSHSGVEMTLRKRIPIGAGLGGGSTDAAAVLKGLVKLWNSDITDDERTTMSATLGSDVPFFLVGGTAYATGRGEVLEPCDLSLPYWILVVTPSLHVSTSWAYANLNLGEGAQRLHIPTLLRENIKNPTKLREGLRNEFEPIVFSAYPEVGRVKQILLDRGAAVALMSGTGSSVFGFFEDEVAVRTLSDEFSSSCHVSVTKPLFKPEPN